MGAACTGDAHYTYRGARDFPGRPAIECHNRRELAAWLDAIVRDSQAGGLGLGLGGPKPAPGAAPADVCAAAAAAQPPQAPPAPETPLPAPPGMPPGMPPFVAYRRASPLQAL